MGKKTIRSNKREAKVEIAPINLIPSIREFLRVIDKAFFAMNLTVCRMLGDFKSVLPATCC